MSDKEQPQLQPQPMLASYYPMYPTPKNDEIDLFELIAQLWRKKWWIVGCMIVTTFIAGIYAFTAKEQWTATAVVDVPGFDATSNYYQGVRLIEGNTETSSTPEDVSEKLFKQFISQAGSYNELSKFISQSDYFKALAENKNEVETAKLLDDIIDKVNIIKDKDSNIYTVSFPASTALQAKLLLESYMQKVNSNVSQMQYEQLASQIEGRKNNIKNQMDALKKIAEEKRLEEISQIVRALVIAEKSGIQKPQISGLTKLDGTNLFLLGKEALSAMSDGISAQPLVFDKNYYDLQFQYINLNKFKVDGNTAQAFSYLKNPMAPITKDKPKRAIILVLGALLGVIVGAAIVLVNNTLINYRRNENN
ncbi:Polysaccharide antigen chain regulator [Pragia fontium]|uniref:LPS O-antigen chain length determinant protein WzzB n=1 Tax=Pragia fontium TaxID=82985 RepID=UPI000E064B28|nr:Wzz/FepE/Etk N-terminal domain-containing protein [Pragia fontium]SUB83286.1 Polysaccharide antigen chain regulator [Pragia fontium]